jgi:uncharacterized membrane protein YesL
MLAGLRAVLRGLNDVRQQGYIYIWANLAFVALSLPLVTMPAAYAALCRVAHQTQTEPRSPEPLELFWETFKSLLWTALPWGLAMAGSAFIILSNMFAYADVPGVPVQALRMTWLLGMILWMALLLFTWPIYYEMAEPNVWGAARNAAVMVLRNPLFTAAVIVIVLFLVVVSTLAIVAWLLLSFGAVAAIGSAAVIDRLAVYRAERGNDAIHS